MYPFTLSVIFLFIHSVLEFEDKEIVCYTYSSGTSIASSECSSDDLYHDDDETFLQNVHLSSCLLAGLDTSDISGNTKLQIKTC